MAIRCRVKAKIKIKVLFIQQETMYGFKQVVGNLVMDIDVKNKNSNNVQCKEEVKNQQQIDNLPTGLMTFNTNINIANTLIIDKYLYSKNLKMQGQIVIEKNIQSGIVEAEMVRVKQSKTNIIKSDIIKISSNVIFGDLRNSQDSDLPLQTSINNQIQWGMVSHDDFESKQANWYDQSMINSCGENNVTNHFLGGHCKLSSNRVTKIVKNLTDHSYARVQATFHIFDNWTDEIAYMEVNGLKVWEKQVFYKKNEQQESQCGNKEFADPMMNSQIDKIIQHTEKQLIITFGSTLQKNSCEASFGIDDLIVYIN